MDERRTYGLTYVRTDGQTLETGCIRLTLSKSQPKKQRWTHNKIYHNTITKTKARFGRLL